MTPRQKRIVGSVLIAPFCIGVCGGIVALVGVLVVGIARFVPDNLGLSAILGGLVLMVGMFGVGLYVLPDRDE